MTIRPCRPGETGEILEVINDSAKAYRGVIPPDCLKDPYMPREELETDIAAGVVFWGWEEAGKLLGVMGLQHIPDVSLMRHAYVRTEARGRGIGRALIERLKRETGRPALVGTWAAAVWAVRFYERNGFHLLPREEGWGLLRRYWSIPARQTETSVVLADAKWLAAAKGEK